MSVPTYTNRQLKDLVLDQINNIKGIDEEKKFTSLDSDQAYNESVLDCGFEHPEDDDEDLAKKYRWLINRMRRWYLGRLWEQYVLSFNTGDMEAKNKAENLQKICDKMDLEFEKAKASDETAALFVDAVALFGSGASVIGTGSVDDRIGQPIETRES